MQNLGMDLLFKGKNLIRLLGGLWVAVRISLISVAISITLGLLVGVLQEKLKTKGIQILEEGLCGRTTIFEDFYRENRNGWKSLPAILESHHPIDGAVLMLGTNDCKACYKASPHEIAKGLEYCIDELLQYIPAENILVVSLCILENPYGSPNMIRNLTRYP